MIAPLDEAHLPRHGACMVLLLALACAAPSAQTPADSGVPTDSTVTADTGHDTADIGAPDDTADPNGLLGARIDPPLAPPAFAVLDADGVTRTEADLIGHPTVLWFFREAEGST